MLQVKNVRVTEPSLLTNLRYIIDVRLIDRSKDLDKSITVAADDLAHGVKHVITTVADFAERNTEALNSNH